ncbi:hypothetical protein K1T71_006495 [Dendrolimus kikuchii]|uniref:Uncharacterized protein n=1 Tax=Dendrolimus kikuchii TaxID=765133 RepID=A0ACC1D2K6_9NEOP|nr:hypothetical protein K1T71_006495 [Dendrolimus kikuchii]
MAVDVRLLVAVLLYLIPTQIFANERCSYMVAIPRPPTPELPEQNFDGMSWSQRPLLPPPEREEVCMDGYFPITANMGTQVIYMEEEIEGDVLIAKLNYQGSVQPTIDPSFLSGSFVLLQPVIRRYPDNTGDWYLIITQRQDYETPGMQQYMFNVRVDGESLVASVSLIIVNIDDNPPIMQIFDACRVDELGEPTITDCTYLVTDPDGEISIRAMHFQIVSDRGDEQVFYIEGSLIQGNWREMYMTVGLKQTLNYETNALHVFTVFAFDSLPNNHSMTLMVQVQNVEHRPPRWIEIFAVQQFDEKTYQEFNVRAIDGDTGINKPIYYRLETDPEDTFFHIETIPGGREGAIFYVDPIDRDLLEREVFQLSIIAYKYDNESFYEAANVVIIINDINDQRPEPLFKEYYIRIPEETPLTLNFDQEFGFHDRDLGVHAQYTVRLESVFPPRAAEAFHIAPSVGYQRQTFILSTINHSMLDLWDGSAKYQLEALESIEKRARKLVVATDMNNTNHVGVATVFIDLENWNDELPIFGTDVHTVSFNETVPSGYYIGNLTAHDRDIGDRVEHSLLGNAGNMLHIDQDTGGIYVAIDDAFDYHRQSELFIQVRAIDTLGEPYNTATSQLVIQLEDVNNTPPTLRLPRGNHQVEENVPEGYNITDAITASDPDTTAELRFEIDWDSSYATKQGRETDPIEYHNCMEIQTLYPNINDRGEAIGRLIVREIRYNVTIDFEEFEVLYLTVRVRDLNTIYGDDYDESTFAITIIDMNDNPPVWVEGTLTQEFRVREMSASGVVIGSVLATDIDGPLYNQVRYTIYPHENTPADLVQIDFVTGQMSVLTSNAIDADVPRRYHLYYTIIASDRCYAEDPEDCPPDPTYWNTEGEIAIQIIDTNNKEPFPIRDLFNVTVYVWENATSGDEVVQIISDDLDRDEIYHTVRYQINYAVRPRNLNFFVVDLDTGLVTVEYTTEEVLDRDGNEPNHTIFFNLIDNFYADGDGNRNLYQELEVLVILLDVNDNAPELPDDLSWSISENTDESVHMQPDIYAPDRDEPDTDNSRVGYAILSLTVTNRDIDVPNLFYMIQVENVTGELITAMPLRGYWGTYEIHILAFDHGIPQQSSNATYPIVIRPFNYHDPVFVCPQEGSIIRLSKERALVNNVLVTVTGDLLDRIEATDEDGLEAGLVDFRISGNAEAEQFFNVLNEGENSGILMLREVFEEDIREFEVTIEARDRGTEPGSRASEVNFKVVFVPTQGEPVFADNQFTVAFIEKEAGMSERHELPHAEDPKNHLCENDCHDIYYRIFDGNADGHFGLDPINNIIYLEKELDRDEKATHSIFIAASNSPTGGTAFAGSILTVTINVRESDPAPIFERDIYTAGISTLDVINRELLTVRATHSENAAIEYTIDWSSMKVDSSLEAVKDSAFVLGPETGILTLNIQPTASMHGMFEFDVLATDPVGAYGTAEVKVYLISSMNRVFLVFVNTVAEIEEHRDFIAQTFSVGFNMTCNIDQIVPATDSNGLPLDDTTEVRAHFIRDNVPVLAEEIELLRSDTILLLAIQTTLYSLDLQLLDFFTPISPDGGADSNEITIYILAALSALLAFLCLVLLITFIIRTRTLNRRMKAMYKTKYGSEASDVNRAIKPAPNTNKHTTVGSNPIYNEAVKAPDFDALSEASDDSDLIGIEDLPQFSSNYFLEDANSTDDILPPRQRESVANHNNNFGFNNFTPFSPGFANNQFMRN